jgi:hypothetical protein
MQSIPRFPAAAAHLPSLFRIAGVGFQTKQRYLFGWFSMKLKLVGNDSAGVVTAYYVRAPFAFPDRHCSPLIDPIIME